MVLEGALVMVLVGDIEYVLEGLGVIVEVACNITVEDVCKEFIKLVNLEFMELHCSTYFVSAEWKFKFQVFNVFFSSEGNCCSVVKETNPFK